VTTQDWLNVGLAAAAVAGPLGGFLAGRRGRAARASKDEADALESRADAIGALNRTVIEQGQRIEQLNAALWAAFDRLTLSDQRAAAAEQRASAAELRAATYEQELVSLRAQVASLTARLTAQDGGGPPVELWPDHGASAGQAAA
jgi:uncharacterized coiled-coil protein SlyX